MDNICSVNRYKTSVDNLNLGKFKTLRFIIKPGSFQFSMTVPDAVIDCDNTTDSIICNGSIATFPIQIPHNGAIEMSGTVTVNTIIEIKNKYNLLGFVIPNSPTGDIVTVKDLSLLYCNLTSGITVNRHPSALEGYKDDDFLNNTLKGINFKDGALNNLSGSFNIEKFATLTRLGNFNVTREQNANGSIEKLTSLINCTSFSFSGSRKISGSVEKLIEGLSAGNKHLVSASTCTIDVQKTECTFGENGETVPSGLVLKCVFSSNGCTVTDYNTQATIATYTKSSGTWTYA